MNENLIRLNGMNALINSLGEVNAEKFVFLINNNNFDYTEWHHNLYKDVTPEELIEMSEKEYKKEYPNEF